LSFPCLSRRDAARNGVFAALLAAEGMTGPDKAIDVSHGVRELLGNLELGEFGGEGQAGPSSLTAVGNMWERYCLIACQMSGQNNEETSH
jgi:hypothetical protein